MRNPFARKNPPPIVVRVQQIVVEQVADDERRREAYNLLRKRIADPSIEPYAPLVSAGADSMVIFVARSHAGGEVVGAAYAGPSLQDLANPEMSGQWSSQMRKDYRTSILGLHAIAASTQDGERHGVGTALITAIEQHAKHHGHRAIIGVAEPSAAPFYERMGYSLLGPDTGVAIPLETGDKWIVAAFPIEGASQWFAKPLRAGSIGKVPAGVGTPLPL